MTCPATQPNRYATWRTRDGQDIPIQTLSNTHLLNIIRGIEEGRLFADAFTNWDVSTLDDRWISEVEAAREERRQTWLRVLRAEAAVRGLEVP